MDTPTLTKHLVIGTLSAFVPIILMSFNYDNIQKNNFGYDLTVRYTPLMFAIVHTLVFTLIVTQLNIQSYWLIGAIFALIYSTYGRFVARIPQRVFEMPDPRMFHVSALVTWGLFYGIVVQFLYDTL